MLPVTTSDEGMTDGRRVHTVRHGQGKTVWTERRETERVGVVSLTTYDRYGPPRMGVTTTVGTFNRSRLRERLEALVICPRLGAADTIRPSAASPPENLCGPETRTPVRHELCPGRGGVGRLAS